MVSSDNLCMSCMREIGDEKKCPYCGYYTDTVQPLPYLPVRTVVGNRYMVGKILDSNSEGTTYIGWDLKEKKAVNIREFLPVAFIARTESNLNIQVRLGSEGIYADLRRSFEEMWGKLAKLNGLSALIKVTDVIGDFSTSYAIYDHFDGISLRDFLLRSKTGYIPWEKARQLLMPTLSTLGTLHTNGIIHRGISPTNLVIGEDGKIKITGFSIGEVRSAGSRLTPQIYDGYAAVEQYGFEAQQGPWTDIYAFAAVLYRTLIGSDPIPSKERMTNDRLMVPGKFAEALPAYVINGLINALQILPQDRTRTVEQLRAELSATPSATAAGVTYGRKPAPPAAPQQTRQSQPSPDRNKKKKSPAGAMFLTAFLIILIGLGTFAALAMTVFRDKFNFNLKPHESTTAAVVEEDVQVPDFTGKYYDEVKSNGVFSSNFLITKEDVYSDTVDKGYIISQDIQADSTVKKGTKIVLTVSQGTEYVELPDVKGESYDKAYITLTELGFEVSKEETQSGAYADNEVIDMSLVPGKKYTVGSKVILKVYAPLTTADESGDENGEVGIDTEQTPDESFTHDTYDWATTVPSTSAYIQPSEPATRTPVQ